MADPALPPGFVIEDESPPLPAGFQLEGETPITDLPAVTARPDFQDQSFTFPESPATGDILEYVRTMRPAMRQVSDSELASAIRRQGYPNMDPAEFYRSTGLDKKLGIDTSVPNVADGMSGLDLFAAGAGKAISDAGTGLVQAGTSAARNLLGDSTGLTNGIAQEALGSSLAAQQAQVAETRRMDAPLLDTGAGLSGNIAGNVGMIVAPGGTASMAAKVPQLVRAAPALTAFGSSVLPTTVRGSTASGAALGAIQPVANEQERGKNIGIGAGGGLVGAAAPRVAATVGRKVASLSPAFTANAQQRAAGEVLERFAQDPAAVRQSLGQSQVIVPGSFPTLAEATEDSGLAGLQRSMANTPTMSAELARRGLLNNQARVQAIEGAFGGASPQAADAIEQARNLAARQTLRPIGTVSMQDMSPVTTGVTRLIEKNAAAKNVREPLALVQEELANVKTVQDAHNVRQYIDQLIAQPALEGKAGGKYAQSELMTVKSLLDRQMRQAFPEWGKFLKEYKAASRDLDQVKVGQALLDKSTAIPDKLGNPNLSAAQINNAAGALDQTVARATGFRKAKAATTLTPDQIKVQDEIARDLARYARTAVDGKAVGSNSMQNALGGNAVQDAVGPVGAAIVEPISGVALLGLNSLRKNYGQKVASLVEEALLDPNRAAEILSQLPSENRRKIVQTVGYLLNQTGSVGGRVPTTE